MLKKNLLLSQEAYGRTTAFGGLEDPSNEGAHCSPSLEGLSGPPEAIVRPQAAREGIKFFLSTLWISSLLQGGLHLYIYIYIDVVVTPRDNFFFGLLGYKDKILEESQEVHQLVNGDG